MHLSMAHYLIIEQLTSYSIYTPNITANDGRKLGERNAEIPMTHTLEMAKRL